jgi:hypothetical protein
MLKWAGQLRAERLISTGDAGDGLPRLCHSGRPVRTAKQYRKNSFVKAVPVGGSRAAFCVS